MILIIGSVNDKRPAAVASVYSATKAAVEAMTVSLAAELGPRGIRINTLAPGLTATDMVNSFYKQEDLAGIANAAAWITGDTITASGGLF